MGLEIYIEAARGDKPFHPYSVLKLFTGFAIAAFID
jgi:hypothetical protein